MQSKDLGVKTHLKSKPRAKAKRRRDHLTLEQRRRVMQSNRSKGTKPEVMFASLLRRSRINYRKHAQGLPGTPDFVIESAKIAVFVDGDFWHGYRFPSWAHTLPAFWRKKIDGNRKRDKRNFARLRRMGWRVVRIWEHELKRNPAAAIGRVVLAAQVSYQCRASLDP